MKNKRDAQEKLYRLFYADMYAVCSHYLAEDDQQVLTVLNDGFLKAFSKLHQFNPDLGRFGGWLRTIMVNTAISYLRTKKRQVEVVYIDCLPDTIADENWMPAKWQMQEIMQQLNKLPTVTRTVFNLHLFEDFSHKEIALELGITETTSRWHLSEARKRLRKLLDHSSTIKIATHE